MSSTTFENIFDHAAAIVRSRRGDTPDVNRLLDDFRRRAMAFEKDPLCNRELIVEPAHEAQVLELPIDLVESVAAELQNLNILHVWVRATCPSGDEETLVETDKPAEFKTAISTPCPHCGQIHEDLDWEYLDTFYAFHFDSRPDKFRFSKFYKRPRKLPTAEAGTTSLLRKVSSWLVEGPLSNFFRRRRRSPTEAVVASLQTNASNVEIPSQVELLNRLWTRGALMAFGGTALCWLISFVNETWAIIFGVVFLIAFGVLAFVTWKAIWAAANMERRVLTCGYILAIALLTASSGLKVDGGANGQLSETGSSQREASLVEDWHVDWEFGETNTQLVWAAVVTFLGTSGIVFGMNRNRVRQA